MTSTLLNGVLTALFNALFIILGIAITALITMVFSYLNKKKKSEVISIGVDRYNSILIFAKGIYFQTEQLCKFIPGAGNLKATMFDKLLLAKFPEITQTELDHFRESIVGEFNSQVISSQILTPAYDETIHQADVKVTIEKLPVEDPILSQAVAQ